MVAIECICGCISGGDLKSCTVRKQSQPDPSAEMASTGIAPSLPQLNMHHWQYVYSVYRAHKSSSFSPLDSQLLAISMCNVWAWHLDVETLTCAYLSHSKQGCSCVNVTCTCTTGSGTNQLPCRALWHELYAKTLISGINLTIHEKPSHSVYN